VLPYLKEGDFEKALENAHTMKGITGNLSLTPLFNAYSEVVSLLRAGDNEKARSIVEGILPTQEDMVSRLEKVIK
jgi:HPt (histidine-containing phosphotransfer) domain-containing protein